MDSYIFLTVMLFLCFSPLVLPVLTIAGYKTHKAGRREWFSLILASFILYVGFPLFHLQVIPGTGWYFDRQFTQKITGVGFTLGKPLYTYETERYFNGDGYSLLIYQLSDEIINQFYNPSASFYQHPIKVPDRHDWQLQTWQEGEITPEVKPIIDFALDSAPTDIEMRARKSLRRYDTYCAFLFKEHTFEKNAEPVILNVDLYILDLQEKLLYVINHNT